MASRRRTDLTASRRRVEDEDEDEQPIIEDLDTSVGSFSSDGDHEADIDEEGSEFDKTPASKRKSSKKDGRSGNGSADKAKDSSKVHQASGDFSTQSADTIAMMNGLQIKNDADEEAIEFGDIPQDSTATAEKNETFTEKRRREHEEYKKKRDADPAFVPNRGGFFMHDSRTAFPGSNGFRGGRGRGRGGRGGFGTNLFSSGDAPWTHDLHETVVEDEASKGLPEEQPSAAPIQPTIPPPTHISTQPSSNTPPNRSFSRTFHVGNVNLRVLLPNMTEPTTFSAVPVNLHTRLPHHRPPLRRDKPVRISIPDNPPRYVFPHTDRSFIFIPRAMRPNQQGFGRTRGRGSFSGYPNFSARNSMFGGSIYTPSIAHSRRSSIAARDIGREGIGSPVGSIASRKAVIDPGKPVVRLPNIDPTIYGQYPPQMQYPTTSSSPVVNLPQTMPQRPTMQNYAGPIPMHQPRPQKQITVADIESPAALNFPPPQVQQQQPFHHQVPANLNGQSYIPDSMGLTHSRRTSHPSQHGTPLSQIPERAVQTQSFQPTFQYQPQQAFYPQPYAPPMYFYAPAGQPMASAVGAPPFIPGQQYPYMLPTTPLASAEPTSQPGTVAHESNGMVYYYDSSQLAATTTEDTAMYQQMAFVPPPPPGYVMAAPQGAVYYTPQ